jgi:hypothetical protein
MIAGRRMNTQKTTDLKIFWLKKQERVEAASSPNLTLILSGDISS